MSMVIDGTAGLTFNNATTQASSSKVLQVVVGSANYQTTTSGSYVDALSATITPLFATSKVLVIVALNGITAPTSQWNFALTDGSNNILQYLSNYNSAVTLSSDNASYLLSPATTSALTYKVRFAIGSSNTLRLGDYSTNQYSSTITLMEIAA
jgi:hypothetical protein